MTQDRIQLKGMVFFGHHGISPEEQALGQRIEVDLEIEADLKAAGHADDPALTIDYSDLFRITRDVVEGESVRLLETLGQRIADRVRDDFDAVSAVWVKVMKPGAPIEDSVLRYVAVEVVWELENPDEDGPEDGDEGYDGPGDADG